MLLGGMTACSPVPALSLRYSVKLLTYVRGLVDWCKDCLWLSCCFVRDEAVPPPLRIFSVAVDWYIKPPPERGLFERFRTLLWSRPSWHDDLMPWLPLASTRRCWLCCDMRRWFATAFGLNWTTPPPDAAGCFLFLAFAWSDGLADYFKFDFRDSAPAAALLAPFVDAFGGLLCRAELLGCETSDRFPSVS